MVGLQPTALPLCYVSMVGIVGIEPTLAVLETAVLPLLSLYPRAPARIRTVIASLRSLLDYPYITGAWRAWKELHPHRTASKAVVLSIRLHALGGRGRSRTRTGRVRSSVHCPLCYAPMVRREGIEPPFPAWRAEVLTVKLATLGVVGGNRTHIFRMAPGYS